jgi:hypothetical protein
MIFDPPVFTEDPVLSRNVLSGITTAEAIRFASVDVLEGREPDHVRRARVRLSSYAGWGVAHYEA